MNPKVSVIMGVYNCESTISQCIDSLLNQTYSNWELIVCDDFSKDKTYQVLEKYREQYPQKIKLLKNSKNYGLAQTLNRCLQHVTGDYIARQDGDDFSSDDRFEKQVYFLNNNSEFDLIGSKMTSFDEKGIRCIRGVKESIPTEKTFLLGNPFCHATIMARKKVYDELKGYRVVKRTHRTEDLDLWYRFFEKGFKGFNMEESLYYVREDTEAYKRRNVKNYINVFLINIEGFKRLKLPFIYYPFLFKPLITLLVPQKIIQYYHSKQNKNYGK